MMSRKYFMDLISSKVGFLSPTTESISSRTFWRISGFLTSSKRAQVKTAAVLCWTKMSEYFKILPDATRAQLTFRGQRPTSSLGHLEAVYYQYLFRIGEKTYSNSGDMIGTPWVTHRHLAYQRGIEASRDHQPRRSFAFPALQCRQPTEIFSLD